MPVSILSLTNRLRHALPALVLLTAALLTAPVCAQTASVDDAARVLAGLPVAVTSPLAPLTQTPSWQRHAKFFDRAFGELEQRQLSKIRVWTAANLAAPRPAMYYMFSGPDFLYANAFYPAATTYVLSALEPVGTVPDMAKLSPGAVAASLGSVERSIQTVLAFGFFITKMMKTDLHESAASGVLPVLYVFLARSGHTIREVSEVALDTEGVFVPPDVKPGRLAVHGVKIVFAGTDGVAHAVLLLDRPK